MAHEIDYMTIADEFQRREQALKDLKGWLGPKKYKEVSRIILREKADGYGREFIETSIAILAGIEGYPVTIWLDFLGFPPKTPKTAPAQAETQANSGEVG